MSIVFISNLHKMVTDPVKATCRFYDIQYRLIIDNVIRKNVLRQMRCECLKTPLHI